MYHRYVEKDEDQRVLKSFVLGDSYPSINYREEPYISATGQIGMGNPTKATLVAEVNRRIDALHQNDNTRRDSQMVTEYYDILCGVCVVCVDQRRQQCCAAAVVKGTQQTGLACQIALVP